MPTKRRQHPTTTTTPNKRHPLTAIAATPPEDYTPDEQDDMLAATEDALDADTFDPPNDGDDDDDIDYPPHLRLSSTSNTQEGTLAFLDDPDEFWQLAMDEEAFDERLFKAAVDEAGAAEKPTLLGRMEKQKARISIEQYMKLLPDMQNHEEYVSTSVYEFAPLPETIDDPLQLHRTNPDWDEWDFRAYLESQKRRQAVDAMWHAEQATVGRFEYEAPNWTNDIRLEEKVPDEGHLHEWSEEEVMQLITQNGRSPRIEEVREGLGGWVVWVCWVDFFLLVLCMCGGGAIRLWWVLYNNKKHIHVCMYLTNTGWCTHCVQPMAAC